MSLVLKVSQNFILFVIGRPTYSNLERPPASFEAPLPLLCWFPSLVVLYAGAEVWHQVVAASHWCAATAGLLAFKGAGSLQHPQVRLRDCMWQSGERLNVVIGDARGGSLVQSTCGMAVQRMHLRLCSATLGCHKAHRQRGC